MSSNTTIRLLILNDSLSEAERLISMLNNAGRPNRAQHVDSEEALVKLLQDQTWDLAIGLDSTQNLTPATTTKQIRRLSKDIPLILLAEEEGSRPIVEGIKLGAVDVVRLDEDQHLLQVITRELQNRENRAQQRIAERRYKEIERRNQQLLDSSRDAIAFLQDGMFLYVNQSFAELLGYTDTDDLECMPVIDTVDDDDQTRVKTFLKDFMLQSADDESDKLSFKTCPDDAPGKNLTVDVRKAQYDEETCIQFMSKSKGSNNNVELEAKLHQIQHQDLVTGLFNKNYLIDKLEKTVDYAVANDTTGALIYITISNFLETVQTKLGVASSDIVLSTIAAFTKTLIKEEESLCRFSEDGFMLLIPKVPADEAQTRAESIGENLRNHIIDIDGATLNFVFHLGVALINETTSTSDLPITHARKALELAIAEYQTNKHIVAVTFEEKATEGEAKSPKELAKLVHAALNEGQFKLLFQPILSLRGSDKEHYEVLLRMVDETTHGMSPAEFFHIAEDIGAAPKIDRWVILESIKLLAQHIEAGHTKTKLIINLGKESLKDRTLPPWLGVAFKAAKLPPEAIVFQIKEMDMNDYMNIAKSFTEQVTALGCECCITHFGCALNPFNALQHISAQYIKVDGSFTKELQDGTGEPEALSKLTKEIHKLDKITIVPFVENASVLSKLWQSGVHYIQGYYLQGPSEAMDYDFDTET